jgi:hypothetical protein
MTSRSFDFLDIDVGCALGERGQSLPVVIHSAVIARLYGLGCHQITELNSWYQ